ncbi:putative vomeronasal receptor-like protein 4 [Manis javanica]|nr:putative vomeronasal receptor-like protein 4 [Manis javanica]
MNKHSSYITIKYAVYPQACIGISANTFLLFLHISIFRLGPKPKLSDLTITHLAVTHINMLLTAGLLVSMDIWGTQDMQSDFRCKVIVFLNKVLRGLSIGTTCLLSVLQAITISPRGSWLATFKPKSPNPILCVFLFLWVLNTSICSNLLLYTLATPNATQTSLLFLTGYCSFWPMSYMHRGLFFTLMTFRDVFFMGLMVLSSGYMVILLYRHKQQSQGLHSKSPSQRSSPEKKATQKILLLMSCFVIIYCVDFITSFSIGMTWTSDPILTGIQMLMANGYATFSPLVLINARSK